MAKLRLVKKDIITNPIYFVVLSMGKNNRILEMHFGKQDTWESYMLILPERFKERHRGDKITYYSYEKVNTTRKKKTTKHR